MECDANSANTFARFVIQVDSCTTDELFASGSLMLMHLIMHRTVPFCSFISVLMALISHISANGFEAGIRLHHEHKQPMAVDSILKVLL